jgi:tetratricopeptide (TPR) repeat protein
MTPHQDSEHTQADEITGNKRRGSYCLAAVIALITLAVYLPALRNDFVNFDDPIHAYSNLNIRTLNLNFFKWAFTTFDSGIWHPLTWLSHGLDYAMWGLKPLGHHLTSIIIHALNTFLVVLLSIRLLDIRKKRSDNSTFLNKQGMLIAGGVAGLLFGLHPLHVESVAWVAERKDVLCGLFYLLGILSYLEHAQTPGKNISSWFFDRFYQLSFFFFVLALLSKPMAVSLPVVLLILEWYPLQRIRSFRTLQSAVVEKLPFFALCLVSSLVALSAQKAAGAMIQLTDAPLATRAVVSIKALMMYLWKMAMPFDLAPFYPYPRYIAPLSFEYLAIIALAGGITFVCIYMAGRRQLWLSLWSFYLITLLPVIGIVQVGTQSMADRYTYLPSLGPFLLIGIASGRVWTRLNAGQAVKYTYCAVAIVLAVSLSYLTQKQIAIWKNSMELWNYDLKEESRRNPVAYNNRGAAFREMGLYDRSIEDANAAISLDTVYPHAYFTRAYAFISKGQYDRALEDLNVAVFLKPDYPDAHLTRGAVFIVKGQFDFAIEDFNVIINRTPPLWEAGDAYSNRGIAYFEKKQFDRAMEDYNAALVLNPDGAGTYINRGLLFDELGQLDRAIADYTKALSLKHESVKTYFNRGNIYRKMGKREFAMSDYRKACDLGSKEGCDALEGQ